MAGREGVAPDDPYRTLQVDPAACAQVIEAAFTVLREMVLGSDDHDAPRRLARLNAAHRTLADPERRAAHDRASGVALRPIDEQLLAELLTLAVANASPEEVMPPVEGPPGWTAGRREAFLAFHRARSGGLDGPVRELGLAIVVEGRPMGVGRLAAIGAEGRYEVGIWLGRSARRRGIGTAALRALRDEAAARGARGLIAVTTVENAAALGALRRVGATFIEAGTGGEVRAELLGDGPPGMGAN